jgi:toxin ParE1/3/4
MIVRFSRRARNDLADIARAIAAANPIRAESFLSELEISCLELATMANAFQVVGTRNGHTIRRRPHGNYVIVYRADRQQVDILRIFHAARDYRKILFPDT